mgnify:CR=1 FL=1
MVLAAAGDLGGTVKTQGRLVVAALGLLLAGCAALPQHLPKNRDAGAVPDLKRPVDMVSIPWPQLRWWRELRQPALDTLVERALEHNPDLQEADARVLLAQAQVAAAHSRLLPHFDVGLSFTQQYFSDQGLHLSANGTSNFYTELNPIEARYHLDLWGQDADLVRAARGRLAMARAEAAQTRLLLSTATALHYLALQGDERVLHQERQLRHWQKTALQVAELAYASGLEDRSAVDLAKVALQQSSRRCDALVAVIAAERHALAALTGQGPDASVPVDTADSGQARPSVGLPAQLPMELLGRRPDIVAARWAVRAAAAQVGAARAAFYPDINLRLLAGWNSIRLGDLFNPGNFAHAVGPAITLPIFEGGALRAQLRAQNAVFLAAQDHYRETILTALQQVADVLSDARRLERDAKALQTQQRSQDRQWQLQRTAWRSGLTSRLPSIEARIQLQGTLEAETVNRIQRLQNWVLLESALGGGYDATLGKKTKDHDG